MSGTRLISSILAITLVAVILAPLALSGGGDGISCKHWSRMEVGEYLLENNVWGDKRAKTCIYVGDGLIGWFWQKEFPSAHPVYPEIVYGKKPWIPYSTTGKLPAKIRELLSLTIEVNYTTVARGRYNILIDVWITRNKKADVKSIVAEVGIYLMSHEPPRNCEPVKIDGYTYCYKVAGSGAGCKLYQFIFTGDEPPSRLDIMRFIRFIKLDKDFYVASVEFGNEVWQGYGLTIIKNITMEVIDP